MSLTRSELRQLLRGYCQFGFHVSRKSWDWLNIPELANTAPAGTPASEIYQLRLLADRVNERRLQIGSTHEPIHGGELASVSFIVDVFRYIVDIYCREAYPGTIPRGLDSVARAASQETVVEPPPSFVRFFPPAAVLQGKQTDSDYVRDAMAARPASDALVREIILLFVSGANPAFRPYRVLFDDSDLRAASPYVPLVQGLDKYFATQPPFDPVGLTLFECLWAPIKASPYSLKEQVSFISTQWAHFLPDELLVRSRLVLDILEEEQMMRGLGPGPSEALRFDRDAHRLHLSYSETAAFSRDADWMSNVILIAKTVYVWLYQLSLKYQRDIRLLSDIPDEELDRLASWGITGLWLIGLWQRSPASGRIKQIMGNPEAASSAYSLYDYVIASDLGGEEAFLQLKERAWRRGIRLASDMVPNHMGIYSKWVIEHPQWFLQCDYPPFPAYRYTGVDLSEDQRVVIQIEDGYWQHRDAAVVFKRIDRWTGDTKYIYHGNDGTSMPWNDTAQLNFMMPEVREAVIQMILHVARKFPIIRFDAAMTLAKRHFQRLWFPQPGEGGAIPSRAGHGMTRPEFDTYMPKEFWREVVDRVAQELPDTLLLAEAFWLMEGYFVRTLGMHRVYNSAFMNMLCREDNANYRTTVKNVLEFSPEVLKRFVNFMNNPDERTAVDQFGRGDKYYGVAVMMVTMPGLPMFGHGQVEGFTEKYGMEYRRSYWDEQVDEGMVRRHETEVFPLMRRRHLFSGAANFAFYDFNTPDGWVDENVFAYSNRAGEDRGIILYNNAYNTTRGAIRLSTAINVGEGEQTMLVRRTLAEALELDTSDGSLYAFREHQSGLEYLRRGRQLAEQGLFAELHAYQYQAFLDFRRIHDHDGLWHELERRLNGAGTPNLDEAFRELKAEPVLGPYRALVNPDSLHRWLTNTPEAREELQRAARGFLDAANRVTAGHTPVEPVLQKLLARLAAIQPAAEPVTPTSAKEAQKPEPTWEQRTISDLGHVGLAWLTLEALGDLIQETDRVSARSLLMARLDQWLLLRAVRGAFEGHLSVFDKAHWDTRLVRILLILPELLVPPAGKSLAESIRQALTHTEVREYLQVHRHNDILWLSKERLERFVAAMYVAAVASSGPEESEQAEWASLLRSHAERVLTAAEQAGYQVEKMLARLG